MRIVRCLSLTLVIACVISGCGPKIRPTVSMERQRKYGRLAIVCAPRPQANPDYAPMILKETQRMISHLRFLDKVDCLHDVAVDTAVTPPVVDFNDVSGYDAVVSLVYSYDLGHVYLDFYMADTITGEQIWYHRFDSPDPAVKDRLCSQGLSAPAIIKKDFYGL
jgi:hypothetical protein